MSATNALQSDPKPFSIKIKPSGEIRENVGNRHWQLFETRLKSSIPEQIQTNYTKSNDYRIIDRFKKNDQPQTPIQPNQRWQTFCSQLTNKSNETKRLMSIYHNVWITNWNIEQQYETTKTDKTNLISNEKDFIKHLSNTEHDKKIIASILHQNI